jgi:diguanylate cyclase (GGDEF)-like protein
MTSHLLRSRERVIPSASQAFRGLLRVDRPFGLIDLCLAMVAVAMVFNDQLLLFLQMTFLLLMLGACYWRAGGFIGRCLLWGGVATAELVVAIATDVAPISYLVQWGLLCVMLAIVYVLVTRRNVVERTLSHIEQHDQLTRLPNRQSFLRRLEEMLSSSSRSQRAVAVMSVDVDDFTEINCALGQKIADELLIVIGQRLRTCLRSGDTVARVGGDKFLIVVEVDPATVARVAERISTAIELPYFINGEEIRITASLGIALTEDPSPDLRDELVRHADAAMRRVKSEGKAGFEVFSPLIDAA